MHYPHFKLQKILYEIFSFTIIYLFTSSFVNGQISHQVHFSKEKLKIESVKGGDKKDYQKISLDDLKYNGDIGEPQLPVKYVRLLIPSGMNANDIVLTTSGKEQITISSPIYPVQEPVPTSISNNKNKFITGKTDIYNGDTPYPSKSVKIFDDGYFDGSNHIVTFAVYPFEYIPKSNELYYYSDISFSVNFGASSKSIKQLRCQSRTKEHQDMYDKMLLNLIDNPDDISKYEVKAQNIIGNNQLKMAPQNKLSKTTVTLPHYEYVIITTNDLTSSFDEFVNWKRRKGVDIGIVTIENISANYSGDLISNLNDNAGKVRQYLSESWASGTTVYALIAGPVNIMPIRYGCGTDGTWGYKKATDLMEELAADTYFCDFNSNWNADGDEFYGESTDENIDLYPEIFVGRMLCQNSTEVLSWTKKIIEYEQRPFNGNYNALTKSLWSQSDDMEQYHEAQDVRSCNASFSNIFSHTFIEEMNASGLRDYLTYNPVSPTGHQIINELNNGYAFYNMYHHGDFSDILVRCPGCQDVDSLTNVNYHNYYWGIYNTDAFPEEHNVTRDVSEIGNGLDNIFPENKSTIVYSIACSGGRYINLNPIYRCMADIFTTLDESGGVAFLGNTGFGFCGTSYELHKTFIQNIFNTSLNNYNIGKAEALSRANTNTGNKHYLGFSQNLFGDPEMPIWTATPSQFANVSVTVSGNDITINTGISDSKITVNSMDNGQTYNYSVTGSSVTFTDANFATKPQYITVTKQNYIPYTAISGGTLAGNTTWSGQLIILGTVTVPSGVTLTINPNTNITLKNNSSIIVNGTLISNGTPTNMITYDFVTPGAGSSNYIRFNPNSTGSVTYSKIKNAYVGIYCYTSSPDINNNTFIGGVYGIFATDFCYSHITDNTISGASNYGVRLNVYSSPELIGPNYEPGGNVITQNSQGMNCTNYSEPQIGTSGGYNSIFNNSTMNLRTSYNCHIYANNTYWGWPVDSSKIFYWAESGCMIYFNNALSTDPNSGRSLSKSVLPQTSTPNVIAESDKEMMNSLNLKVNGKYDEAIASFSNILSKEMKTTRGISALAGISECYEKSGKKDFIDFLNKTVRAKITKDERPSDIALELESHWLIKNGKYDEAIKKLEELKTIFKNDDDVYKLALHSEIGTYMYYLNDKTKAKELLNEFEEKYPNDIMLADAKILLGEIPGSYIEPHPNNNEEKLKKAELDKNIPESYVLQGNYPNPFNPTTTLSYGLPRQSSVEVKIYDIMGNEVRTFTFNSQEAGYHTLQWDGRNSNNQPVSSGTYIYKLIAVSTEDGKVFERSAKMLLLK